MATSAAKRIIIYGGKGALGSACVSQFKSKDWWVCCIDKNSNEQADVNCLVKEDNDWNAQAEDLLNQMKNVLKEDKVDGVICVAGGWMGGNAAHNDFIKSCDLMWKQSVWSSAIAANIATQYLKPGGFVSLTGADAATDQTPGMIGYGMAKAAIHQLTKSLAGEKSGLPKGSSALAILPITLDTPMNRQWMPKADKSKWTPLEFLSELFWNWAENRERPPSGSLLRLVTTNNKTDVIALE